MFNLRSELWWKMREALDPAAGHAHYATSKAGLLKGRTQFRCHICGDRNASLAAMRHIADGRSIFTGKLKELAAHCSALIADTGHIGGRVLDPDDVGAIGK